MDWQTLINLGLGGVLAFIGWFAREIWDSVKELRKDIHQIEKGLPEIYVRKDDLKEVRQEMAARFDKLENIIGQVFDRLHDKVDK
jgi:tetrahydromethanopterin S-methyltransferase subunit G